MNDGFSDDNLFATLGYCAIGAAIGALIVDFFRSRNKKKKGNK